MDFFPMFAAGLLFVKHSSGSFVTGGSCAAYGDRTTVVTAAHCVPSDSEVYVQLSGHEPQPMLDVVRHPTADVAILTIRPDKSGSAADQFYVRPTDRLIDGGDFYGFGYPVEGSENALPVGRLFKGHFQRYFGYEPTHGGSYFAGEMSIAAPAGLSGGPLAYVERRQELIAVVTTNHDSWVTVDRFEEVERDGVKHREEIRRVVSYGIAVMLQPLMSWLDEHTPPPPAS